MNKYDNRHQQAHENAKATGQIMNSTVNKSGANLTNNFQRSKNYAPQTQRSGNSIGNSNGIVSTGRAQNKTTQGPSHSSISNNSYAKGSVNKPVVSNMTAKLLGEHQDKENRQKLSNKTSEANLVLKRNKTSEASSRQSIVHKSNTTTNQGSSSNHKQSKSGSSLGTTQRNNNSSSLHNTNRSSRQGFHVPTASTRTSNGRQSLQAFKHREGYQTADTNMKSVESNE